MTLLRPSSHGGLDQRTLLSAYVEARLKNDTFTMLRILGCPEQNARKAAAYAEVRAANPNLTPQMEDRIVAQKLSIMGVTTETRTEAPSESYLRARVAELGRVIASEKRDAADDEDDTVTCPQCGHEFSPDDQEEN